MDKVSWDFSMKNIPIPPKNKYLEKLVEQTSKFVRNARWKALFTLKPEMKPRSKMTYGFKSLASPPIIPELRQFEEKLIDLIQNIEFRDYSEMNNFQNILTTEVNKI